MLSFVILIVNLRVTKFITSEITRYTVGKST